MFSHWEKFVKLVGLKNFIFPPDRCYNQEFYHNLPFNPDFPNGDGELVCKSIYGKEVVKVTVQITDPSVTVIEKDVSATFSDMLGIVGKLIYVVII